MAFAFKDREEVVLCCTSTFHRRYLDDLVQVMALPNGGRVRLRYREPYCQSDIRALGKLPPGQFSPLSILIAYVRFVGKTARYLPLRAGKIVDILTEGSVTYLEVELGDFVESRIGVEAFSASVATLATEDLPHKDTGEAKPSGVFLQSLSAPPPLHSGSGTDTWERVAQLFLKELEPTRKLSYVFGFNVVRRSNRTLLASSDGVLLAPPVSELEVHVRVLIAEELAEKVIADAIGNIEIDVNHPHCSLSMGGHLPIDAPRNIYVARLSTSIGLRKSHGRLRFVAKNICANGASPAGGQRPQAKDGGQLPEVAVEMPIKVGPSQLLRLLLIGSIAFGLGVHALDVTEMGENWAIGKAVAVALTALIALYLGVKPAADD